MTMVYALWVYLDAPCKWAITPGTKGGCFAHVFRVILCWSYVIMFFSPRKNPPKTEGRPARGDLRINFAPISAIRKRTHWTGDRSQQ